MRPIALAALAMCFLAANSILTRAGVEDGTDPLAFAAIRVGAGALMLTVLAYRRGITIRGGRRWGAALALAVYLVGFSLAYRTLDAGLGALILFAMVQLGLFGIGASRGERTRPMQAVGMATALVGLIWLLWPDERTQTDLWDALLMVVAGLAWAFYSLAGRFETKPLAGSAGNFLLATGLFALAFPIWLDAPVTGFGAVMAVASGALASGLGYAMLFRVLPAMDSNTAGLAQLSVPVIAMFAGAVILAETPSLRAVLAAGLVLIGIALATVRRKAGPQA